MDLAAYTLFKCRYRDLIDDDKKEVRVWFKDMWPILRQDSKKRIPKPKPVITNFPDKKEIAKFWDACVPVTKDKTIVAYLEHRGIEVDSVVKFDLARAMTPECMTSWSRFGKGKSWYEQGHRLALPLIDHHGTMKTLRARWVMPHDPPLGRKTLNPYGYQVGKTVLANQHGISLLRNRSSETGDKRVVFVEGDPDFLTWSTKGNASWAVFGVFSGTWSTEFAKRIPMDAQLSFRLQDDEQGKKYKLKILESLKTAPA